MAINTYLSDDGTAKVSIDTSNDYDVSIIDVDNNNETFITPISPERGEDLDGLIVPGFKNGWIMMKIARYIKEALT